MTRENSTKLAEGKNPVYLSFKCYEFHRILEYHAEFHLFFNRRRGDKGSISLFVFEAFEPIGWPLFFCVMVAFCCCLGRCGGSDPVLPWAVAWLFWVLGVSVAGALRDKPIEKSER
jgi:hypothetical protein